MSSYTFDTIWAILASYGQNLLFIVSITGPVIEKKKKNGGIFQIRGGGGGGGCRIWKIPNFFFFFLMTASLTQTSQATWLSARKIQEKRPECNPRLTQRSEGTLVSQGWEQSERGKIYNKPQTVLQATQISTGIFLQNRCNVGWPHNSKQELISNRG